MVQYGKIWQIKLICSSHLSSTTELASVSSPQVLSGGQTHVLVLQDLETLRGAQARRATAATSAFLTGRYKYKTSIQMGSLYRKYHLTRHWGDDRMAARGGLRPGFSSRCRASGWRKEGKKGPEKSRCCHPRRISPHRCPQTPREWFFPSR